MVSPTYLSLSRAFIPCSGCASQTVYGSDKFQYGFFPYGKALSEVGGWFKINVSALFVFISLEKCGGDVSDFQLDLVGASHLE